jgi:hypothetical protein
MTIHLSFSRQDWALLRTPATKLAVALLCGAFFAAGPYYFRSSQQLALQAARTEREMRATDLRQAKDEKQTIEHHIKQYRKIEADGLMGAENRLSLIEAINQTRERYRLYPVQIEIEPQRSALEGRREQGDESAPENSGTGIGLMSSRIKITLPLLHEADIFHFLEELQKFKGLFVVENCAIHRTANALLFDKSGLDANLSASCQIFWLTLQPAAASLVRSPGDQP